MFHIKLLLFCCNKVLLGITNEYLVIFILIYNELFVYHSGEW